MPLSNLSIRQQHFDTALAHLRRQGCRSIDKNGRCMYRGPNNMKCAIGALIPDDLYQKSMEGLSAMRLFNDFPVLLAAFQIPTDEANFWQEPYDADFYSDLQDMLHDSIHSDFNKRLESRAKKFALQYGVTYKEPQA